MKILALDPGTKCGFACAEVGVSGPVAGISSGVWDLSVKKIKKKEKSAGKTQLPNYYRLRNLWELLYDYRGFNHIVIEGAAGFTRGKGAVEASHKFRGIVELFCSLYGIDKTELPPQDLKRFALGKGIGEKQEMIDACFKKFGFVTADDNVADAYLLLQWAYQNIIIPF
jgi:hypothetical protein